MEEQYSLSTVLLIFERCALLEFMYQPHTVQYESLFRLKNRLANCGSDEGHGHFNGGTRVLVAMQRRVHFY